MRSSHQIKIVSYNIAHAVAVRAAGMDCDVLNSNYRFLLISVSERDAIKIRNRLMTDKCCARFDHTVLSMAALVASRVSRL